MTVACTLANKFLLRCSASRARMAICSWFRFCSVISLATFDAPTILPSAFLTGDTVSETTIKLPCLRCRMVSKWSIRSPRLTRVRMVRFAKLVELFHGHGVSFVSVTQQFNTTTSMGRLTLNVLLSFAQFEREVTSERIRDKIAASKRKGLWVGGI